MLNRGVRGKYANTSVISGLVTVKEQFVLAAGGFYPLFSSTTSTISRLLNLLVKTDGSNGGDNTSISDSSTNTHSITVNGNSQTSSFSPYDPEGYSYYFDGSGDYLSLASSTDFTFDGDFTIDFWINVLDSNIGGIVSNGQSSFIDNASAIIWDHGTQVNKLSFWAKNISNTSLVATNTLDLNKWYFISVVRDNGVITIYEDGVSVSTYNSSSTISLSASGMKIGAYWNGQINAYISDFRIVKGTALYTADFTPPTSRLTAVSGTSLLTCHLPYLADGSSTGHTLTVTGNVSADPLNPYRGTPFDADLHGGSVYFDGTGDYLSISSHSSFAIGTGDFTMEAWIWNTGADYFSIFQNSPVTGAVGTSTFFFGVSDTGSVGFNRHANGGGVNTAAGVAPLNTWNHVAAVRDSTSTRIYVNGILEASTTDSAIMNYNAAQNDYTIGYRVTPNYGQGYLTDVRLIKGTALYTAAFTPPTEPLTAVANTSLLIKGNESAIYDATGFSTLVLNGNATTSTTQTKYASSSIALDGTGDYISLDKSIGHFGTSDFTIEGWWYFTTVSAGYQPIITLGQDADQRGWVLITETDNEIAFYMSNGSAWSYNIVSTTIPNLNAWNHIAVTRNSGTLTMFLNGASIGTGTIGSNSTHTTTSGALYIGHYPFFPGGARSFNGYIEDVRITKGLSRYPFIPAKETLTAISGTSLLTAHTSSIIDGSSNSHSISAQGNSAVSTFAPKQGMYSIEFDGNSSDLEMYADSTLAATTNTSWTFEGWFYRTGALSAIGYGNATVLTVGTANSATRWALYIGGTNGVITVQFGTGSWAWPYTYNSPTGVISLNKWHHVAIVRDGSTSLKMFVDGRLVYSNTSANFGSGISGTFYLGSYYNNYNNDDSWYHGYMSNIRMVQGTALYSNSFTPPTEALT